MTGLCKCTGIVAEAVVLSESPLGRAVCGSKEDAECLETALKLLSNGSFPLPGTRDHLSNGQRRQLRDAMILCAHVRAQHDVLASNDERAFINNGRRAKVEAHFRTRVMTVREFETHLTSLGH
jgi:hypothetical protein